MEYTNGDVPKTLKLVMLFIDRVGFPVLAFILMFFMSYTSLAKVTKAMEENTRALVEFSVRSSEFQKIVCVDHDNMKNDLKRIMLKDNKL